MIIVMKENATEAEKSYVVSKIEELGFKSHPIVGEATTIFGAVGLGEKRKKLEALKAASGVAAVIPISKPYKLASREVKKEKSTVKIGSSCLIGAGHFAVIAGPCSVENEDQVVRLAKVVRACGGTALR